MGHSGITFFILLSARRPRYPPLFALVSADNADVATGSAGDSIDAVPTTSDVSSGAGDCGRYKENGMCDMTQLT